MKNKVFISLLFITAAYAANTTALAQDQIGAAKHATADDSAAMNALVLYPANIRLDIFEASEYPSAIVDIAALHKRTSNSFADLVAGYPKEEQENFYNLSRYPALVTDLVRGGSKTEGEINIISSRYPEDIHDAAIKSGRNQDVLRRMEELKAQSDMEFVQIISDYPVVTQNALRELIQYPEIMNLLNEHLDMTVRVGAHYRRDPKAVIARAEERNIEEVRQNAEDAAAWKQNMEQNPEQAADLKNAATDYAVENGYSTDEINTVPDPGYIASYTVSPYSYWFGYPTWYPYSYWYPYPFWFDCGFYYGPGGNMVFLGHPSYYFTNWYFYNPEHIHHYPHLCNTYVDHYYGRRHSGGNDLVVHNWVQGNRDYLPRDFTTNRTNRVDAIRQVGQLNDDARKDHGNRAVSPVERDQYFQKNSTKYPVIGANHAAVKVTESRPQNINIAEPERQPAIRINPRQNQQPAAQKQEPRQESRPEAVPQRNNFNEIQKAQEYHRNVWQGNPQPQRQQAPPSYSQPVQRSQPAPQPARQSAPSAPSPRRK